MVSPLSKTTRPFFKKGNIELSYDPIILLLGIITRNENRNPNKNYT
jgi:hypothetical protein